MGGIESELALFVMTWSVHSSGGRSAQVHLQLGFLERDHEKTSLQHQRPEGTKIITIPRDFRAYQVPISMRVIVGVSPYPPPPYCCSVEAKNRGIPLA